MYNPRRSSFMTRVCFPHVHTNGSCLSPYFTPPWITKSYRATYGVVSWCALLERGRQRNRRHYSHRLPLFRLLTDVNRLSRERPKSRAEAGEQVGLIWHLFVILRHDSKLPQMWTKPSAGWVCINDVRLREKPFNVAVPCACPREPISAHQQVSEDTDWQFRRGV